MSATKSSSSNSMQRVARHLYRRGQSYTFRRAIKVDARPAFGGIREYVRSLGDITEPRAKALATVHNEFCSRLIEEARGRKERPRSNFDFIRIARVPEREEVERAVREWLVEVEEASSAHTAGAGTNSHDQIRALQYLDAEVIRIMRAGTGDAPLMTRWIADALIERHRWSVPQDGPLRSLIEDRVARGQRELAARLRAELAWEDHP